MISLKQKFSNINKSLRRNKYENKILKKEIKDKNRDIKEIFNFVLENNNYDKKGSKAQLKQDVFVLIATNFKKNGFFVEFGATNGVDLSNTYLLEKEFGWNGILAEPSDGWHTALFENRNCFIEPNCVWNSTGEKLEFDVTEFAELSTISQFSDGDIHASSRKFSKKIIVDTISLGDLLKKYDAPKKIDYLSVDTEGSEFEILSAFDFNEYQFNCITVEHNHTPQREKLYKLLTSNGYRRVLEHISRFDDWYVADR